MSEFFNSFILQDPEPKPDPEPEPEPEPDTLQETTGPEVPGTGLENWDNAFGLDG